MKHGTIQRVRRIAEIRPVGRKADINACGTHYTPYFVEVSCYCIARHKKHHDVAECLIDKGAVYDIHSACFLGDLKDVIAFLKAAPKQLNNGHPQHEMADEKDRPRISFVLKPAAWATPLCYALRGGDIETVKNLIKCRANIKGNEKALFIAANDSPDMVRLLLDHGAKVDVEDLAGETALFDATRSTIKKTANKVAAIELLLKAGASPAHKNHRDQTPLSVAQDSSRPESGEMVRILKRTLARKPRKKK